MTDHDPFEAHADAKAFAALLRDKVGLSNAYASELANARRRPSLEVAAKIEALIGIPAAAWMSRPLQLADKRAA